MWPSSLRWTGRASATLNAFCRRDAKRVLQARRQTLDVVLNPPDCPLRAVASRGVRVGQSLPSSLRWTGRASATLNAFCRRGARPVLKARRQTLDVVLNPPDCPFRAVASRGVRVGQSLPSSLRWTGRASATLNAFCRRYAKRVLQARC